MKAVADTSQPGVACGCHPLQCALGYPNDRWRGDPLPLKVWPPNERDDIYHRPWQWVVLGQEQEDEEAEAAAVAAEAAKKKKRDPMKRVQSAAANLSFTKEDPYL